MDIDTWPLHDDSGNNRVKLEDDPRRSGYCRECEEFGANHDSDCNREVVLGLVWTREGSAGLSGYRKSRSYPREVGLRKDGPQC